MVGDVARLLRIFMRLFLSYPRVFVLGFLKFVLHVFQLTSKKFWYLNCQSLEIFLICKLICLEKVVIYRFAVCIILGEFQSFDSIQMRCAHMGISSYSTQSTASMRRPERTWLKDRWLFNHLFSLNTSQPIV